MQALNAADVENSYTFANRTAGLPLPYPNGFESFNITADFSFRNVSVILSPCE